MATMSEPDLCATAPQEADPLVTSIAPKLEARVAQIVQQSGVPGVSVGVVHDQALVWSAGFGYADVAAQRRPDEHTVYRVGSITKTVTATALMQLRDAGMLRLDDPLVRHIPEFGVVRNPFGPVEESPCAACSPTAPA